MRGLKILPYKIGSESAKAIARELQVGRIRLGQHTRPITQNLVINWGCSNINRSIRKLLNRPEAVALASNKLKTFETLHAAGVSVPEWSITREDAEGWLDRGFKVFCRHKLSGHNGEGIEVIRPEDTRLPRCPLYVKHVKKDKEYRVHVFNNRVIDITEKRRRSGVERTEYNGLIRNLENGWVFCRDNVHPIDIVRTESIRAVRTLGLDFGAVDIVVDRQGRVFILEINTAPGLQGTTLDRYIEAIRNHVGDRHAQAWR